MNYERINFKNGESGGTPINNINLNKMDKGIADLYKNESGNVLYENSEGSNGDITLNDVVTNYEYIEIFYRNESYISGHRRMLNYGVHELKCGVFYDGSYYERFRMVNIADNTITTYENMAGGVIISRNGTCSADVGNLIYIIKVVGYKEWSVTE